MKRKIDGLIDTFKLKQEFKHDKLFLMAMIKSFVKREWKTTHHFLIKKKKQSRPFTYEVL